MPFTQQTAWKQAQLQDRTLQLLTKLIETGQAPEKRKTCNEYTTLKLLYNLYCKGMLKLSGQGLITVTQTLLNGEQTNAIVVPASLYPGLVHSIHIKTMHSSKVQLQRLMTRYFYAVGHQRMISEAVENCHICLSLKQLPKELFPETTGEIFGFGSHFACDIMNRNRQSILLIREKLTQFTQAKILEKEDAFNILSAVIELIADKVPEYGTVIRTDNATPFQKLNTLSQDLNSSLKKFHITLELGQTFNHNRNPIAENLVKEFHKEINKAGLSDVQLDVIQLMQVVKCVNSRIRNRDLSAKEMCYLRDQVTNKNIMHKDEELKNVQKELRERSHNKVPPVNVKFDVGDTVMIKDQLTKTKPREKFIVVDSSTGNNSDVKIQKQDKKFMAKQYDVKKHQLIRVPRDAALLAKKRISDTSHFLI